jgi:hypothetical protein
MKSARGQGIPELEEVVSFRHSVAVTTSGNFFT